MNNKQKQIQTECLELGEGESTRFDCPWCGDSGSFVATRSSGGILYTCHRNSCEGSNGFIASVPGNFVANKPQKPKVNEFKYDTVNLSDKQKRYLEGTFGLKNGLIETSGVLWAPELQRLVFPVFDRRGYPIGNMCRFYPVLQTAEPCFRGQYSATKYRTDVKAVANWFTEQNEPRIYYPGDFDLTSKSVVIVEDIISAIRVNCFTPTVALMGTNISFDVLSHLCNYFSDLLIWLDADAIASANKYKNRYGLLFNSISIIYTDEDPKDLSDTEIKEQLRKWKNNKLYQQLSPQERHLTRLGSTS